MERGCREYQVIDEVTGEDVAWTELERIDFGIRMNYWLVEDGRHPAVDYESVWAHINALLERRLELVRGTL